MSDASQNGDGLNLSPEEKAIQDVDEMDYPIGVALPSGRGRQVPDSVLAEMAKAVRVRRTDANRLARLSNAYAEEFPQMATDLCKATGVLHNSAEAREAEVLKAIGLDRRHIIHILTMYPR